MELVMIISAGLMMSAGIYALLNKNLLQLIIGIMLLGHGANLIVFMSGGLVSGAPAFVAKGSEQLSAGAADPLPQALVLTAIVIGFGMTAFVMILFHRSSLVVGSVTTDGFVEKVK